jgi:hypothetical protein
MLPSNVVFPVPIDEDHRVQFVGGVLPGAGLGPGVPIDEEHGVGVNINHETFVVESILIGERPTPSVSVCPSRNGRMRLNLI